MDDAKKGNYQKLKELISKDQILLLPHKKYRGLRQSYVYARCGMSLNYFDKAYENKKILLQFGEFGPRVGSPILWQDALEDYLSGGMDTKGKDENETISLTKKYLAKRSSSPVISEENGSACIGNEYQEIIVSFENTIRQREDQLFGMSLFQQGVSDLYSGNKDVVEKNNFHYQNILQRGQDSISRAKQLLSKVQEDKSKAHLLMEFEFPPIEGNPMLDPMTERARLLVDTYNEIFPGRPKEKPLSDSENSLLMKEVCNKL